MAKGKRRVRWSRIILKTITVIFAVLYAIMYCNIICINSEWYIDSHIRPHLVDATGPTIILNDGDNITVEQGVEFKDPGVEVYDDRTESTIESEGKVDTSTPGEYEIKYLATDEHGNQSKAVRKVNVIKSNGRIYLTFDDGPGASTGKLLDILKKYNVKATFFVTGYGDDELIRREQDEGHAVGLHTLSHDYSFVYTSPENFFNDLYGVQDRVKRITGKTPMIMRFPGGSSNMISRRFDHGSRIMSTLTREVSEKGFSYFDWNIDSFDAGGASTPDEVSWNVINALKWGGDSVILQHDIKPYSVDAVEKIIQFGQEHNFVFRKLSKDSFNAHHGVNN